MNAEAREVVLVEPSPRSTADTALKPAVWVKAQVFVSSMSIRTKIASVLVAVLCLAIASLGFVSFRQQKLTLESEIRARVETLALQLAASAKTGLLTQEELAVSAQARDLMKMPGVDYVIVHDSKGRSFAQAVRGDAGIPGPAESNGEAVVFRALRRGETPVLEATAPITTKLGAKVLGVGTARVAISASTLEDAVRRQAWTFFWITGVFVLLGLAISFALGKLLTRQILVLMTVMRVVSQGNLNHLARVESRDEIGRLAETLNDMILKLREKLHMEKYLSRSTLQLIKKLRDSDKLRLGGERRHVAVLFTDIRGFTAMTEISDPEEVLTLLNIYLNLQAEVIYQRNGVVDKFVGDAVMAIFTGEHAEYDATLAAQEIRNFIATLNDARGAHGKRQMTVGIGLNAGTVIMGNMGSERQMDYTVIGDPINTAARLCSEAHGGQVIMSLAVVEKLGERCLSKRLEPVSVKGKRAALEIHELLDVPGAARRYMRRQVDLTASCRLSGIDEAHLVRLRDVGTGGCSFLSKNPIPAGAEISVELTLPGSESPCVARGVVRHAHKRDGQYLTGMRFSDLDEETRTSLTEWVHNVETEVRAVEPDSVAPVTEVTAEQILAELETRERGVPVA